MAQKIQRVDTIPLIIAMLKNGWSVAAMHMRSVEKNRFRIVWIKPGRYCRH